MHVKNKYCNQIVFGYQMEYSADDTLYCVIRSGHESPPTCSPRESIVYGLSAEIIALERFQNLTIRLGRME
jgi:hypothetical protein